MPIITPDRPRILTVHEVRQAAAHSGQELTTSTARWEGIIDVALPNGLQPKAYEAYLFALSYGDSGVIKLTLAHRKKRHSFQIKESPTKVIYTMTKFGRASGEVEVNRSHTPWIDVRLKSLIHQVGAPVYSDDVDLLHSRATYVDTRHISMVIDIIGAFTMRLGQVSQNK